MLNDVHIPYHIKLNGICSFIKDFDPHYLILAGDILDCATFSHYKREVPRAAKKLPKYKRYYEASQKVLNHVLEAAKRAQKIYMLGNHEAWAEDVVDLVPELEGMIEVQNNITGIDAWVAQFDLVALGKLWFVHGEHALGKYHAQNMVNLYRRNLRYGHRHEVQEASFISPIDLSDQHTARSCGTLMRLGDHPGSAYTNKRPSSSQNGFTFGYVRPDGLFADTFVHIINDRFIANGKEY